MIPSHRDYEGLAVSQGGRAARRRGLTLLELLLALAGTALIGAAIATMLTAVTYGSTSRDGMRTLMVRQKVVTNRLAAAIRDARAVLCLAPADPQDPTRGTALVLWDNDANADGRVNLSELRRLQWNPDAADPASGELWCYTPAAGIDDDTDATYGSDADFDSATRDLIAQGKLQGARWAQGVVDWSLTLDRPDAVHLTRLVTSRLELTCKLGDRGTASPQTSLNMVALRCDPARSGL